MLCLYFTERWPETRKSEGIVQGHTVIKILTPCHGSEVQMSGDQPGDTESVSSQIPKNALPLRSCLCVMCGTDWKRRKWYPKCQKWTIWDPHSKYNPTIVMKIYICTCPNDGRVLIKGLHLNWRPRWDITSSRIWLSVQPLYICLNAIFWPTFFLVVKSPYIKPLTSERRFQGQNVHHFLQEVPFIHSFTYRQGLTGSHAGLAMRSPSVWSQAAI